MLSSSLNVLDIATILESTQVPRYTKDPRCQPHCGERKLLWVQAWNLVLVQLTSKPRSENSSCSISRARMMISSISDMTATSSAKSKSVKPPSPVWGHHSHDEWCAPWSNKFAWEPKPGLQHSLVAPQPWCRTSLKFWSSARTQLTGLPVVHDDGT